MSNPEESSKSPDSKGSFVSDIKSAWTGVVGSVTEGNNKLKENKDRRKLSDLLKKPPQGPPYKHIDDYAWTKAVIAWSNLDTIILLIFTIIIWTAWYLAFTKPIYGITASPSLQHRMEEFTSIPSLDRDIFGVWLVDTLETLHQTDPTGKPFLPGIVGQINPEIYEKAVAEYERNRGTIKKQGIVKNLNVTRIVKVYINKEDQRISAFIRGYIITTRVIPDSETEAPPPRVILPYRAKVIVEKDIESKINPTGYYLTTLQEKLGKEAIEWERQEMGNEALRGGSTAPTPVPTPTPEATPRMNSLLQPSKPSEQ